MANPNQQSILSPQIQKHRQTMWQVEPYNRHGKRLNQNAYLDKLIHHAKKAELSFVGALIYCRQMCIKHGYPTAF
ncbi:hypothetical protein [Moraxella catarrhalis]|uniref:hypothetical protein n=1 Tax=Moraxella catarrhalis TaxID=480 RepID=UPI0001D26166|nr:hypothetical protein [Moraxella catarrhalis]ADG61765.1 hypothetical protein MCR_1508 [Moraxella catarrhalis BBH18]MCG6835597.1 hypothetical protein [Moraxella catarrhalis]MPW53911.1 hypothetical protein [Moraxella catarrhalis]MPW76492.1 hypothetical protein [Moraxella catarrhalis]MPX38571.1 hypothetical protein [Moraxella catarrhalis]